MGDAMENKETQLARIAPRAFSLLPSSLGEAHEMAKMIADSDFAPKDYKGKPANVLIAVQMGADLGLKPMQALQNIAVINGKPSIYGDGALALVQAGDILERFHETLAGENDSRVATCIVKRKGWPDEITRTFSVADAKKAGLWGKAGPWQTYPDRMLQMRARGFALRDAAADRLMGLVLAEEAMDYPTAIDTTAVHVETVPPDPMERIPEGLRETLGKAFEALNLSAAQRLAKLNEYLGKDGVTPDEGSQQLLDWCRDEYAKRKTGLPRKKAENGNAKPAPPSPLPGGATTDQSRVAPSGGGIGAVPPEGTPLPPATPRVTEELF